MDERGYPSPQLVKVPKHDFHLSQITGVFEVQNTTKANCMECVYWFLEILTEFYFSTMKIVS